MRLVMLQKVWTQAIQKRLEGIGPDVAIPGILIDDAEEEEEEEVKGKGRNKEYDPDEDEYFLSDVESDAASDVESDLE